MIVKDLFDDAVGQLKAAGIDEAENDVRILLEHYLGLKRNDLFMKAQEAVPEDDLGAFQEALNRRIQREP